MNTTPGHRPSNNRISNSTGLRRSSLAVLHTLPAPRSLSTPLRALPVLLLVFVFLLSSILPALAADEVNVPPATPNIEGLVVISDDVKTMDEDTITNSLFLRRNVRTVRVPKTVKKIKKGTFDNYPNLETIEFYGKEKKLKLEDESIPEDVEVVFVDAKTSETSVWSSSTTKASGKTTKSTTKSGSSDSGSGNKPSNQNSDLLDGDSSDSSSRRTTKSTTKSSNTSKSTTKSNNTTKSTTSSKTTKKSTTKSGTTKAANNSTTAGSGNKPTAVGDGSEYTTNESQSRLISEMAESYSRMAEQYAGEHVVAQPYNVEEEVDIEEDPIEGDVEDAEDPLTDEELKALEDGAADGDLLLDENGDPVLDEDGNPVHSSLASYDSADRHVRDVSYVVTGAAGLSAIVLFILKLRRH